ncbi:MAG: aspartate aminotransferase family protein, partial [Gammaproteobacteria bacterium]|nr:aspartate aminotransferase family protein [Gammaproteobacteria bacterium]
KTLELISAPGFYDELNKKVNTLVDGILEKAKAAGIAMTSNTIGGMFGLFFTEADNVTDFQQATQCNVERFQKFYHGMLNEGIYLAPSAYEAGFVSSAHTDEDLQKTIDAAEKVFSTLK